MREREELERILLGEPGDEDARLEYARLLHSEGDADGALRHCELALTSNPDSIDGLCAAARALVALERPDEARVRYRHARGLTGFIAQVDLEPLVTEDQRKVPVLELVSGHRDEADVSDIRAHPREAIRFVDIAGMEDLKKTLRLQIIEPFLKPGLFQRFKKKAGGGVLLYGPPGCGKTMLARALATECKADFFSVGISDVLNLWLGESERNLCDVFERARSAAPSVLFFDELDALAYSRSKSTSSNSRSIVNEFLSQLDGFGSDNTGVLILAATNMPWDVDSAMKRPGRFNRQIFVPPPDAPARESMLSIKLLGVPCEVLDLRALAQRLEYYSGADIDGLIDAAKDSALAEMLSEEAERSLRASDFESALDAVDPSTLDWLRTAKNLVRLGGADRSYRDVEKYLKKVRLA